MASTKARVMGSIDSCQKTTTRPLKIYNKKYLHKYRIPTRCLSIFWPRTISNEDLYHRTNTVLSAEIKQRTWRRIGHINRMDPGAIRRVIMRLIPTGKRKRGRPKVTSRRSIRKEMVEIGWNWSQVQRWSSNRQH